MDRSPKPARAGSSPGSTKVNASAPLPPPLPERITVVTFNVAEFQPSHAAPLGWDPLPAFRSEVLRQAPDVVCLQEMSEEAQFFLIDHGYQCIGTASSHCGLVGLLLKAEWVPHATFVTGVEAPAVLVSVSFSSGTSTRSLVFGSAHLMFSGTMGKVRFQQMRHLYKRALRHDRDAPLILGGDCNMRGNEDDKIEGLGLRDAWKATGSDNEHKFTWDTVEHKGGRPWNQYHSDGPSFRSRYDRIYFRGNELSAVEFRLFGNETVTNNRHYLSDHFGLKASFRLDMN